MGTVVPFFQRLQKEGESGRKKITQLTRYLTVLIAAMQSYGIVAVFLPSMSSNGQSVVINPGLVSFLQVQFVCYRCHTFDVVRERITEENGNGISLIIMIGIVSRLPNVIVGEIALVNEGVRNILQEILLLGIMFCYCFVILLHKAQEKYLYLTQKELLVEKFTEGSPHIYLLKLILLVLCLLFLLNP